ncbi:hypothetical protein ACFWBB_01810 [Streptomyces sp. NPDC060000]|uniref:hypothetical protein n=1 Tax=Streptomyces sp. NPDC060000 TaxID=3347031 RepID=UPI0036866FEF
MPLHKLRIGFADAQGVMFALGKPGVAGPAEGGTAREALVEPEVQDGVLPELSAGLALTTVERPESAVWPIPPGSAHPTPPR